MSLRVFSWNSIISFPKFWYSARNSCEVLVTARLPVGKNDLKIKKMDQKQGFYHLLKNLVIKFYWICSVINIILFAVFLHKSRSGKFLFLAYGPKCSQPIRLQDFIINHICKNNVSPGVSLEWIISFLQILAWWY